MKLIAYSRRLLALATIAGAFAMIHGGCSSLPGTSGMEGPPSTGSYAGGAGGLGGAVTGGLGGAGTGSLGGAGTGGLGGSGTGSSECQAATDCPGTDTDCAHRTCTDDKCDTAFKPDGFPTKSQMSGDCQTVVCDGHGGVKTIADDDDLPNDSNPCTQDICESGVPGHPPAPSGTACGTSQDLACDGMGNCAECTQDADCGTATACTTFTCTNGACSAHHMASGQGNPGGGLEGNCMKVTCDGQGGTTQVFDDTNIPDDGNPCTIDLCIDGVPSHTPTAAGSSCGDDLECDGAGTCSFCLTAADCGTSSACVTYLCQSGACVTENTPLGMACPDDGNPCTNDACNGTGTCAHPMAALGTSCGAGQVCDAGGTCAMGCVIGGMVYGTNVVNPANACQTCNPALSTSSWSNKANGTACNDSKACTANDICTNGTCGGTAYSCSPTACQATSTCNGNGGCTVTNKASGASCTSDGNPCTTDACDGAGNCKHPAVTAGTTCGSGLVCNGGGTCASGCYIGGIFYGSGVAKPGNACQVCNPGVSTSTWSNNDGTTCNDGNACTKNDVCTNGTCGGTAYTCSPGTCQASSTCDGNGGCTVTNASSGTSCGSGKVCNGSGSCVQSCVDEPVPTTCSNNGQVCGNAVNNCGHTVWCGSCGTGKCCFDTCVCSTRQCP